MPNRDFLAGDSLGYFNMLLQAIIHQELPAGEWNVKTPLEKDTKRLTKLKRGDLIKFAEKRGLRTDFLTPDQKGV